jgi:hemerythrin-like domain-containing protein
MSINKIMKTASQDLIHEHKAIQIILEIIEKIREKMEKNEETNFKDINEILEFLKEFADKCHHGKEENILFPALEKIGMKNENGPIGIMLSQHNLGRDLIKKMQESILFNPVNKTGFINAAENYVYLMRVHINKENNILFPICDTELSASEQNDLLRRFEEHETKVIGAGRHEELHAMIEKFTKKYLKNEIIEI